jgi:hypothetical protein
MQTANAQRVQKHYRRKQQGRCVLSIEVDEAALTAASWAICSANSVLAIGLLPTMTLRWQWCLGVVVLG